MHGDSLLRSPPHAACARTGSGFLAARKPPSDCSMAGQARLPSNFHPTETFQPSADGQGHQAVLGPEDVRGRVPSVRFYPLAPEGAAPVLSIASIFPFKIKVCP